MAKPRKEPSKSWLTTTFILLLILPLQINWNIRIHPLLYHWLALQPLAKYPRQSWKVQPNEWFNWQKFRCKMSGLPKDAKQVSEQADGWRAGLQQVLSHLQPRWGCLLVFKQLQSYLQHRRGKGPNPGRVQIVTLSKAQREFREGLYEPSGDKGANFGQMIQEAKYFRLTRQWLREGYTATRFESHFIT